MSCINTRQEKWETRAISRSLQSELPGQRGFSAANIENKRIFFEEWSPSVDCSLLTNDLEFFQNRQSSTDDLMECFSLAAIRSSVTNDLDKQAWNVFLYVGFLQHIDELDSSKSDAVFIGKMKEVASMKKIILIAATVLLSVFCLCLAVSYWEIFQYRNRKVLTSARFERKAFPLSIVGRW